MKDDIVTNEALRSFVERIERLESDKAEIMADIKEVKSEAKFAGFDVSTINQIIKLRRMDAAERAEKEALLDLYKAALGMLDGTPLGAAAVDRLQRAGQSAESKPRGTQGDTITPNVVIDEDLLKDVTIFRAREMGAAAAACGAAVTTNPFPAHDPRRAVWDEAWCAAASSDGMDIPEAWRATKKVKNKKPADNSDDSNNGTSGDLK